jgi:hypothetical protein
MTWVSWYKSKKIIFTLINIKLEGKVSVNCENNSINHISDTFQLYSLIYDLNTHVRMTHIHVWYTLYLLSFLLIWLSEPICVYFD